MGPGRFFMACSTALIVAFGCSSSGGSDGAGGSAGASDASAGSGGGVSTGGTGGTGGAGGQSGGGTGGAAGGSAAGGTAGSMDAGDEDAADTALYEDPRCQQLCPDLIAAGCANGPTVLADCIEGCTVSATGPCSAEFGDLFDCAATATFTCMGDEPVPAGCESLGQAAGACQADAG